ncbi:hypothetical protein BN8_06234 [Fibrisoma limi BUZ 3]|uniref:Uncharacterized protein n=1 Tax=Fibrisoma limi BUZ 3 TaxID=1185876 RepID=I2GSG7_9BACT|nr:hypothetical protein [Fibrisoma limi]CCH56846.1 hypothetical protein BN8_06234 [Fibrisoma limi BUZ 3]
MAQQDQHTVEYVISQQAYEKAYRSLPEQGTDQQKAQSAKVMAKQYRLNTRDTANAGKWVMWSVGEESFEFTWQNGAWRPPANIVVLNDADRSVVDLTSFPDKPLD